MKLVAGSLLSPTKTPGTQRKSLTNKILFALSALVGNCIQKISPKKTPRPPSKHITNKHLCVLSVLAGNRIQSPLWETHKKSPTICGAFWYVRYND